MKTSIQGFLVLTLLALGTTLAGYLLGVGLSGRGEHSAAPPIPTWPASPRWPTVATAIPTDVDPSSQQPSSFLIVMVDSLSNPAPRLEMCLWGVFQPEYGPYYLFGVSPDAMASLPNEAPQTLQDIYRADLHFGPDPVFLRLALHQLHTDLPPPEVEVTVDRQLVSNLLDTLGGMLFGETRYSSAEAFAYYDALPLEDTNQRSAFQIKLLQSIVAGAEQHNWSPQDLTLALNQGQTWQPSLEQALTVARHAPPLTTTNIQPIWETPTPVP